MSHTFIAIFLAGAAALFSGAAHAESVQEQTLRLSTELMQTKTLLEAVNRYHGAYRLVRDEHLFGDAGVVAKIEAFNAKAAGWIAAWQELQQVAALADSVPANDVMALAARIKNEFLRQSDALNELETLKDEIAKANHAAREVLERYPAPVPALYKPAYRPQVVALLADVDAVRATLARASTLALELTVQLRALEQPSKDAFLQYLQQAIIDSGRFPLQQALNGAREAIRTEKQIDAALSDLNEIYRIYRFQVLKRRVFHAQAKLAELNSLAVYHRGQIQQSGLPDTTRGLHWIDNLTSQAQGDYNVMVANGVPAAVYQQSRFIKRYFQDRCAEPGHRYRCDLAQTLSKITRPQIEAMNDATLRAFEASWDDVGPISPDATPTN